MSDPQNRSRVIVMQYLKLSFDLRKEFYANFLIRRKVFNRGDSRYPVALSWR